ncbi:MAG: hypothetical protein EAZ87_08355 [Nostocales cyanobacterium]|nr:MAG: hypothetical protein EAZ87_08355 [Nostocales cyanobacterium]
MNTTYLVGWSVLGLFFLNCQSSIAFNIYPSSPGATFRYQPASSYSFRGSRWQTEINYNTWAKPLPRGGTPIFKNTLKFLWAPRSTPPFGQGWKFESANTDLEGFFDIKTYYACAFAEPCGGPTDVGPEGSNPERPNPLTKGVGAVFSLQYNPRGSDPIPLNNNLHWIQVVRSNRTFLPFVDNSGKFDNPYYDSSTNSPWLAGSDFLIDRPYFFSPASPGIRNFFTADLYLVEYLGLIGGQKRVRIYNGIRWGWKNIPGEIRDQNPCLTKSNNSGICPPPSPPSCNGSSGGGGCIYRVEDENQLSYFNDSEVNLAEYEEMLDFNTDDTYWAEDQEVSYFDMEDIDDTNWTESQFLKYFNIDVTNWIWDEDILPLYEYNNSESPTSVPESTSTLGLLLLSVFVFIKSLTITKD